jgi:hypothetical protein
MALLIVDHADGDGCGKASIFSQARSRMFVDGWGVAVKVN